MVTITFGEVDRIRASTIDKTGGPLVHLRLTGPDVPIVDRLKITRLVAALTSVVVDYEGCLQSLLTDCGAVALKDNPGALRVPPERMPEYRRKLADLHKTEVEVSIVPLPLEVISKAPLTVDDLGALQKFYVEPSTSDSPTPPLRAV